MTTQRDRREAAEILRRIVATLPDPTPVQIAFLLGQASALDEERTVRSEARGEYAGRDEASVLDALGA